MNSRERSKRAHAARMEQKRRYHLARRRAGAGKMMRRVYGPGIKMLLNSRTVLRRRMRT